MKVRKQLKIGKKKYLTSAYTRDYFNACAYIFRALKIKHIQMQLFNLLYMEIILYPVKCCWLIHIFMYITQIIIFHTKTKCEVIHIYIKYGSKFYVSVCLFICRG